jgi:iron only hydrogenase large subunit-like protein
LYKEDAGMPHRESHNNESIKKLYAEYLDAPLSEKARMLLHTSHKARPMQMRRK